MTNVLTHRANSFYSMDQKVQGLILKLGLKINHCLSGSLT